MLTIPEKPICYPPAPTNGGRLEMAPRKVGEWRWQPKIDDWRAIVHAPTGCVWNQYGQPMSIADKFGPALDTLLKRSDAVTWLDCGMMNNRNDMMRGTIVVIDLIERGTLLQDRRAMLEIMFDVLPWATEVVGKESANDQVYLIPQVGGEDVWAGNRLYLECLKQNEELGRKFYEGVVAKRLGTSYRFNQSPKAKTADWIKHRFDQ